MRFQQEKKRKKNLSYGLSFLIIVFLLYIVLYFIDPDKIIRSLYVSWNIFISIIHSEVNALFTLDYTTRYIKMSIDTYSSARGYSMTEQKSIMTPRDVAEETASSLRFIYKQLRAGVIPHVRLGYKYLIGRKSFEAWLNGDYPPSTK